MSLLGLASLIHPRSTDDFLDRNWSKEPYVVHGLSESIREIRSLPYLASLDALLGHWTGKVQAHLPDVSDEASSVDASPEDAKKLFKNRMGLLFNNVERRSPELARALARIREDLGLPSATYGRSIVYATPDGKGTAPHFDQNINFVLQLHGTKKWWLAANESVENPTERFTIGQPVHPELASYLAEEFPQAMPTSRQEYILAPGSMLFVPRGYWHSTEAEGDALALNFTFSQPTWIDLFTTALRSRLSLSPEWRELADGVGSKVPSRRERGTAEFDALLLGLAADLPNWRAAEILAATEADG
jgi:50S ribosomal protein L16 3-hydroxylase